ncbi:MAG: hypothetical protein ACYDCM_11395 [Candidatus Acidiferrales bacterium]
MLNDEVMQQARQYFAQEHEINFLEIKDWILVILATIGKEGRSAFNAEITEGLNEPDMPAALKVAWNKQIERLTSV